MKDDTREIKIFLWKAGKTSNSKKNHLRIWETVCRPKICGGARVRDPNKMNLALGAKILWRIVSGKKCGGRRFFKKNI